VPQTSKETAMSRLHDPVRGAVAAGLAALRLGGLGGGAAAQSVQGNGVARISRGATDGVNFFVKFNVDAWLDDGGTPGVVSSPQGLANGDSFGLAFADGVPQPKEASRRDRVDGVLAATWTACPVAAGLRPCTHPARQRTRRGFLFRPLLPR
jgi:hypothetical protein